MSKQTIKIRTPIWKTRSVGIADFRLDGDVVRVEILYKDKSGNRVYPGIYEMEVERVTKYHIQRVRGVNLHIIPIRDFKKGGKK